ncbi:triple tyrosine motif-containing protein [Winogradskyella sp. PE311]|uniref:helix-turn-helix and ligand-binding sensor domain-containing protein n=1 Tax=Winogradskyella sp. PE311 TaxID=3366943 RepID=UPI003980019F
MSRIKKVLYILLLLVTTFSYCQEIPPIQIFTPQDYNAEDQNWSVTQSQDNFIYVANNSGLLEYNGAYWRLFKSLNNDILRSVRAVEDKIYSGGYMDFGFWKKDEFGKLLYTSLSAKRKFSIQEDEEFWKIIDIEGYILFQSLESIYIYNVDNDEFSIVKSESRINKMFKVNETILFQKEGEGVFQIENGIETLAYTSPILKKDEVINIYDFNNKLLFHTKEKGFFLSSDDDILPWDIEGNDVLLNASVYSSIRLRNGNFLIGTISKGVIELSPTGKIVLKIDQLAGLSNNTVLSLKEDAAGNAWLGLDNGINILNLNSKFKVYEDKLGVLGTIYTSALFNDFLYLGTNQGLFYKKVGEKKQFKFIEGTKGQVWTLEVLKDALFCGHDKGTFMIRNGIAERISDEIGTWVIKEVINQPNLLIQGNYKGLYVLEFINGKWKRRNKIKGFNNSSRYIEFVGPNEILVNHEHKGIYKIDIDKTFESVLAYKRIPIGKGIKSSIVSHNNSVLYSYKEGSFYYNKTTESFEKDSILSALFSDQNYWSGKFVNDKQKNKLWGFSENEIIFIEPGKLSKDPKINKVAIPGDVRRSKPGYENVLHLDDNNYLIGGANGYLILDLTQDFQSLNTIFLNEVSHNSLHNDYKLVNTKDEITLENKNTNVTFKYSVPNYEKLAKSKYQYRLIGIYDTWSEWSTDAEASFENLPYGDYSFEARSITGTELSENIVSYNFRVEKPWYLKPLAVILYVILLLTIGFLVHYFNKRYYKKQKQKLLDKKQRELEMEQLDSQRRLVQFKNENLQLDIENKNRELGTATMSLVKRNELLNNIKDQLSRSKSPEDVRGVIKMINSNLNNTSDWKLFEEAFNNVDKEFMKKIKALHPSITPNDLRLCAYLRLNLSSKEIAPLLNISHKSVEVKRYRLRKKMGLDHEQNLANYILEL